MRAKVMPDGRIVEARKRHGLIGGGEILVEDIGTTIVLRTVEQIVAHAQSLSRRLLAGKTVASVDDFLADRAREAE